MPTDPTPVCLPASTQKQDCSTKDLLWQNMSASDRCVTVCVTSHVSTHKFPFRSITQLAVYLRSVLINLPLSATGCLTVCLWQREDDALLFTLLGLCYVHSHCLQNFLWFTHSSVCDSLKTTLSCFTLLGLCYVHSHCLQIFLWFTHSSVCDSVKTTLSCSHS